MMSFNMCRIKTLANILLLLTVIVFTKQELERNFFDAHISDDEANIEKEYQLKNEEIKNKANNQPHLIMIVADDLGWNDVSWHNAEVISPNLDLLATNGIILNQSYVQPICSPTRSALLASRYPFTVGRQANVIYPMAPTGLTLNVTLLPQELKKLGYDTHIVGKWHLGFCKDDYTPTWRGFDSFHGFYTGSEDYYTHYVDAYYSSDYAERQTAHGYDFRKNADVDESASGEYSAFLFAEHVSEILYNRDPATPLFLYLPFQSVHAPLQVPDAFKNLYSNINDEKRRTLLGMVSAMDDAVGQVIEALISTSHYENSVIVFTTDNGGPTLYAANNWPLRGNKSTLWEGGTRGSAFIHSPLLQRRGTVSNRMIHVTDWYPTFIELAGGSPPTDIDGVSQWEALTNATAPDARDYFVYDIDDTTEMRAALRWTDMKLIVGDPGSGEWIPPPQNSIDEQPQIVETFVDEEIEFFDADLKRHDIFSYFWYIFNLPKSTLSEDDQEVKLNEKQILDDFVRNPSFDSAPTISHFKNDFIKRNAKHFAANTTIQLYNVTADPKETVDLSAQYPDIVEIMLNRLSEELTRYVPKDVPASDPKSDPVNFNGTWSAGWC